MEAMYIASGFSDLGRQFISKTGCKKLKFDLKFHFTVQNGFLSMHDYNDHKSLMVLAIYDEPSRYWRLFTEKGSLGEELVLLVTTGNGPVTALARIKKFYREIGL
jgi:hypothetical protein